MRKKAGVKRSKRGAGNGTKKTAQRAKTKPRAGAKACAEEGTTAEVLAPVASARAKPRKAPARPVTREWVLGRLAENVRRAMQIEPVTLRGQPTGEFRHEGSVANRALELLGKELGLFVEKSESVSTHHVVSGEPISEAKWEEQYAKGR